MPIRLIIEDMRESPSAAPELDVNLDAIFDRHRTWRQALCEYFARHESLRIVPKLGPIREQLTAAAPTPHHRGRAHGELLMAFTLTDSQEVIITTGFTDKRGNPASAPAGDTFSWAVDNTQLLAVAPSADGLSAVVSAVGPLGSGTVSMKLADASGAVLASGSLDVTIIGGAPVNVVLTPGTATEEPDAPAPIPAPAPAPAPETPTA